MKKIIYIFILPTILFLTSCSKGGGGASSPEISCNFTGAWEGQYNGGDNGIMSGIVNSRCDVSGTIYSNNLGMFDDISGIIESDGYFYGSITTGAVFEGQINGNYASGTWLNAFDSISGTWSMSKQVSSPQIYPINGVWQYDSHIEGGVNFTTIGYNTFLFIWENEGLYGTEVYGPDGNITNYSTIGQFSLNSDQSIGVFTHEMWYDPSTQLWYWFDIPSVHTANIDKLNYTELDYTVSDLQYPMQVESHLTQIPLPPLGIIDENMSNFRKKMIQNMEQIR